MKFLRLIRYQNLLLLAFMQLIFRFGFLKFQNVPLALADWQFGLLVLATVCIAAGGYIINAVYDRETDTINRPESFMIGRDLSESAAYNWYAAFNIIGVGAGFYLSNVIEKPSFAAIFIVISGTLYMYSAAMKQSLLIGNIIVALLLAFSILIIGVFDLFPAITLDNKGNMATLFGILIDYAVFAFILNFIREIVKDLEDINGDYNAGMSTLPIVLGVSRTVKLVFALSLIPIGLIIYYINQYLYSSDLIWASAYGMLLILAPLLYVTVKLWQAKTQQEFHHISSILKLILLFGIISIAVITFNIKYNA